MSILLVEFPKLPTLAPPKPMDVFDVHPRPWKLGESKTSTTAIVDANGAIVGTIQHGGIISGHRDTPQRILNLVNATA